LQKELASERKELASQKKIADDLMQWKIIQQEERESMVDTNRLLNNQLVAWEAKDREQREMKDKMEAELLKLTNERDRYCAEILKVQESYHEKMNEICQLEEDAVLRRRQNEGELQFLRKENDVEYPPLHFFPHPNKYKAIYKK